MAYFKRQFIILSTLALWWLLFGILWKPIQATKRMSDRHKYSVIANLNRPSVALSTQAPDIGFVSPKCVAELQYLLNSTNLIPGKLYLLSAVYNLQYNSKFFL